MERKKNSRKASLTASRRHLRNSKNMNRFLLVAAVIIISGIFFGLRYQNKSLRSNPHPKGNSSPADLPYYSGSKSFKESYQREKDLKDRTLKEPGSDQNLLQKEYSGKSMIISISEQAAIMQDKLKTAKSLIHQDDRATENVEAKEVDASTTDTPENQADVKPIPNEGKEVDASTTDTPKNQADVKPIPKPSFIKNAKVLKKRWTDEQSSLIQASNTAVIEAASPNSATLAGQLQGVDKIKQSSNGKGQ